MIRQILKQRKFLYVKEFKGEPTLSNFQLVETELPALKDGEILTQAEFLSVDPYMRPYMANYAVGCKMIGGQVGTILESKHPKYTAGSKIFGQFGWESHSIVNPDDIKKDMPDFYVLPEMGNHPISLGLGYLGMPGNTALFGLNKICQPKPGETVAVTGAGGAVGTLVGQLAKLKGCKAIGFAGSDDKCQWLEKELGFDKVINYKSPNLYKELKAASPKGIDCYFDNVGGEISSMILSRMNLFGRVAVCGAISSYNSEIPKVPAVQTVFVFKQLKMEGFLVWRWNDQWMAGLTELLKLVQDGKIKYQETITEGFENTPQAFIDMLRGRNFGKAVVKV